ncbi:hypothetical protein [Nonomuraea basaltis]|uniref:hypothetical protein n=1 Tax=Nonomuraea basaltis TaxID=2495887 RepID=UPI00110C653F|nr:hypothetical protein [Nonomuraea basaltis]TMR92866.1 hypothetical protein EJK15_42235 [Nonomuraea basaltis]
MDDERCDRAVGLVAGQEQREPVVHDVQLHRQAGQHPCLLAGLDHLLDLPQRAGAGHEVPFVDHSAGDAAVEQLPLRGHASQPVEVRVSETDDRRT